MIAAWRLRILFPILLTYFLDNFGLALIYPIFTPLMIESEHSLVAQGTSFFERTILLGFLIAAFPLAQFFGAPIIGQFSDRFGRKKAFCITILGAGIGYIFTAVSLKNHSLLGLFVSRFATGIFASNLVLCLAAIADISPQDASRTRTFSLISATGGLSFILAIAFGGVLSNIGISPYFDPSVPFWIIAFLSFVNLASIFWLFRETHHGPHHPGSNPFKGFNNILKAIRSPELRIIYYVNFLFMITWVACMQFLPTFLLRRFRFSIGDITLCLMGIGALWSLSNLIINRRLAKFFFSGKILLICLLLLSITLLFTLISREPISFLILIFCSTSLASLCWTNGLATVSLKAPPHIQGSILGINQSVTSVAAMLGPIVGGFLIPFSEHAVYVFGGIASLLAFSLLFFHHAYNLH